MTPEELIQAGQGNPPPTSQPQSFSQPSFNSNSGGSSYAPPVGGVQAQPMSLATKTPTLANNNQDYGFLGNIGHTLDNAPLIGGIKNAFNPGNSGQTTPNNPHGQYFTGSLFNKAMDVLNTPQYAAAGFGKGAQNAALAEAGKAPGTPVKTIAQSGLEFNPNHLVERLMSGLGNVIPGIQNRTQYGRENGDYNAGAYVSDNPLAQTGINFGLSLAAPTLPVSKVTGVTGKALKGGSELATKIPVIENAVSKAGNVINAAVDTAKTTPKIYNAIEQLPGLEHFRNPEVGKIITEAQQTSGNRISGLFNTIADAAKGLSKEDRVAVGTAIENPTAQVAPNIRAVASKMTGIADKIGQELVDLKVMSPDTFAKYQGQYMSHIADVVKNGENTTSASGGPLKFFMNSLKERKDVLGSAGNPDYIREFQYPTFKALAGETQTAESAKAIKQIAETTGEKVNGFENSPIGVSGPRLASNGSGKVALQDVVPSKIAGQYKNIGVPPEVADYLKRAYGPNSSNILQDAATKALSAWKLGKTIYSGPGYHARNIQSNIILSDFSTKAGLPATVAKYAQAVAAYMGKGTDKMRQYAQELKDAGVFNRQNLSRGAEELKPGVFGENENKLMNIIKSPIKFQQATEETAKLGVYSTWRDRGLSIKDAATKAEEAIFSPYRIGQNEKNLVKNIVPFYSFTRQALPFTAKTAFQSPSSLTKYTKFKTAVEGLSPEGAANNSVLPDSQKNQIRLPIKDKNGNYQYYDPTYVYPWGNFDNQAGGSLPFGLSANPLLTETASQIFNKDLYFNQPIAKSTIPDRANTQRAIHAFQTFAPNLMPTDVKGGVPSSQPGLNYITRGGSNLNSAVTGAPDYAGRTRSLPQSILNTFGIKSAPFSPADQLKSNQINRYVSVKDIQSEMKSTLKNMSLSPEEKRQIIIQLQEQLIQSQQGAGQ